MTDKNSPLEIYDASTDTMRMPTQMDIDRLQEIAVAYGILQQILRKTVEYTPPLGTAKLRAIMNVMDTIP